MEESSQGTDSSPDGTNGHGTAPSETAPRVTSDRRRLSTLGPKPTAGFENDGAQENLLPTQDDVTCATTQFDVVTNFGAMSTVGMVPRNPNKVNQDSHWEIEYFANDKAQFCFGVADGHGCQGKEVSETVRKRSPCAG